MPSVITHLLFGESVLAKTGIITDSQVYYTGTQGPDVLFYRNPWPWSHDRHVSSAGSCMHAARTRELFSCILNYANSFAGLESDRKLLISYIYGFTCHYVLDSETHPYINYLAENYPGVLKMPANPEYRHSMIESRIDVLLLERYRNMTPYRLNIQGYIDMHHYKRLIIGALYSKVLNDVFNIELHPVEFDKSVSDMILVRNLLRNRSGIKKILLGFSGYISSKMHDRSDTNKDDLLNDSHIEWYALWDKTLTSTASFLDLYENAANRAASICTAINSFFNGGTDIEFILNAVGSKSFDTGN